MKKEKEKFEEIVPWDEVCICGHLKKHHTTDCQKCGPCWQFQASPFPPQSGVVTYVEYR